MSKILVATTVALLLASCGTPTVMYNPETKEMAQCERPPMGFFGALGQSHAINECAEAYERAGWQRM